MAVVSPASFLKARNTIAAAAANPGRNVADAVPLASRLGNKKSAVLAVQTAINLACPRVKQIIQPKQTSKSPSFKISIPSFKVQTPSFKRNSKFEAAKLKI